MLYEVGLDVTIQQLTGIYYEPQHDMHHFVFTASYDQQHSPTPSSPEILECRYYSLDELPRPMKDFTYRRIKDALNLERKELFHLIKSVGWLE